MGDVIFILVIPPTFEGLLIIYPCWLGWWNSAGTQCCLKFHLFFQSFIKLMLVFQVVLYTNYIPSPLMLALLLTFVQWVGSRAWESGRTVNKGGLALENMVKYQPPDGASGQGGRGKRHHEDKGKYANTSSIRTEQQRNERWETMR